MHRFERNAKDRPARQPEHTFVLIAIAALHLVPTVGAGRGHRSHPQLRIMWLLPLNEFRNFTSGPDRVGKISQASHTGVAHYGLKTRNWTDDRHKPRRKLFNKRQPEAFVLRSAHKKTAILEFGRNIRITQIGLDLDRIPQSSFATSLQTSQRAIPVGPYKLQSRVRHLRQNNLESVEQLLEPLVRCKSPEIDERRLVVHSRCTSELLDIRSVRHQPKPMPGDGLKRL